MPVGEYIVDFPCFERKLVVELDGGEHHEQTEYDVERTRVLEFRGYRVPRFRNNHVAEKKRQCLKRY